MDAKDRPEVTDGKKPIRAFYMHLIELIQYSISFEFGEENQVIIQTIPICCSQ